MKTKTLLCLLLLCVSAGAAALSIYNVQYTVSRGVDNSYPSAYTGKTVTVEGVVCAARFKGEGFFLSEPLSGAWRGIMVRTGDYDPTPGTYLRLTARVAEHFGMTCLQDISKYTILDRNRPQPKPVIVTTGQLDDPQEAEAYEGVYIRLVNVSATGGKTRGGSFTVNDGSGQCRVLQGSFGSKSQASPAVGSLYSQIAGIVTFAYGEYALNPIGASDIQSQQPVSTQNRSWGKIKSIYK